MQQGCPFRQSVVQAIGDSGAGRPGGWRRFFLTVRRQAVTDTQFLLVMLFLWLALATALGG